MAGMKVDFNSLRRKACDEFDAVVRAAKKTKENRDDPVYWDRLAKRVNDLRQSIIGIALCYDEHGNEDVLGERDLECLEEDED